MDYKNLNVNSFILNFIISFYRFIGITFGGISFNENGDLIKSKFWYYFSNFGCCYHFVLTIILTSYTFIESFQLLISSQFFIVKLLVIIWQIVRDVIIISTSIILNKKYGFKIIKIIMKYSLTKLNKLQFIAIIWFIQFCVSIIIFSIAFFTKITLFNFLDTFNHDIIFIPLMHSTSFVALVISFNFTENIKIIRNHLNHTQFITSHFFIESSKFLVMNFQKIQLIDKYLSIAFISLSIGIISSMLQFVYLIVVFTDTEKYVRGLPFQITIIIQLIFNCFINGKLLEETQNLLCDLDNIDIDVNDEQLYKSLILFKKSIRNVKCGFSIGGFAPWNKLTLLKVIVRHNFSISFNLSYLSGFCIYFELYYFATSNRC